MPKQLNITTTYNSDTRQLQSIVTMTGFIEEDPARVITGVQTDTLTLFSDVAMSSVDQQQVVASVARALLTANADLGGYADVYDNLDKADEILAASEDPSVTFENNLDPDLEG